MSAMPCPSGAPSIRCSTGTSNARFATSRYRSDSTGSGRRCSSSGWATQLAGLAMGRLHQVEEEEENEDDDDGPAAVLPARSPSTPAPMPRGEVPEPLGEGGAGPVPGQRVERAHVGVGTGDVARPAPWQSRPSPASSTNPCGHQRGEEQRGQDPGRVGGPEPGQRGDGVHVAQHEPQESGRDAGRQRGAQRLLRHGSPGAGGAARPYPRTPGGAPTLDTALRSPLGRAGGD